METRFSIAALADPDVQEAEQIIKQCIHCGCCNAGCPTFDLLDDELDSPRGRIYLLKDMLENGRAADRESVLHLDRCLSCLGCLTTCPSNVDYMHLIDHGRVHIENTYQRPLPDRMVRALISLVLPYPSRFRTAMHLARPVKPLAELLGSIAALKPVAAMLDQAPTQLPKPSDAPTRGIFAPQNSGTKRVLIPSGCVQQVLDADINASAIRLLNHFDVAVEVPNDDGCCGALVYHLGKKRQALEQVRRNIDAWHPKLEAGEIEAIVITTSGCGTTIKDYGHMLANDPDYRERARQISESAVDISQYLVALDLPKPERKLGVSVAYHSACSLQHGQKIMNEPRKLLLRAGFKLKRPENEHLCCGSAGTYSILQSDISRQLRDNKVDHLSATDAQVIAAGNIGCIKHIGAGTDIPIAHTVELLDWAYTGHKPRKLADLEHQDRKQPANGHAKD
ncbi:MAG: glycolate oxidase subunit GlcF [Alphaproteobacteria bacterium]|nr:glycolate oxidase subunit GlcF [Alphaproteobacteria bacterium]